MGCAHRFIQRQIQEGAIEPSLGNTLDTGCGERNFPEQQNFGLAQFLGRDIGGTHLLKIALHDSARLGNVRWVACIIDQISPAGLADFELGADMVNQPRVFTKITIKAGGIKCAAQHVIAKVKAKASNRPTTKALNQ